MASAGEGGLGVPPGESGEFEGGEQHWGVAVGVVGPGERCVGFVVQF